MAKRAVSSQAERDARRAAWKAICARARGARAERDAMIAGRTLTDAQRERIAATPIERPTLRIKTPKTGKPVTWR